MARANPELIRLVAARFYEMQGLRTIGDASLMMMCGATIRAVGAMDSDRVSWSLAVVLVACTYAWLRRLRPRLAPYYATRFGRVGSSQWNWFAYPLLLMNGVSWINSFGSMPLYGPKWVIAPLALWPVIPLAGYPGWIARRDFPARWHWAVVAIVVAVLALGYPFGAADSARSHWFEDMLLYGGGAIAFAGLCDHAILVRVLRGERRAGEEASDRA